MQSSSLFQPSSASLSCRAVTSARAAALDCGDPSGRLPKPFPDDVAVAATAFLCVLCVILVNPHCASLLRIAEPSDCRQRSAITLLPISGAALGISSASNHFGSVPFWAYSSSSCVLILSKRSFRLTCSERSIHWPAALIFVSLDCRDYSRCGNVHFARLLDDPLQCDPDVALALCEQSKGVRMTVDAGAVCESILPRNGGRTAPRDEIRLDLFPLGMRADGTVPPVASQETGWSEGVIK